MPTKRAFEDAESTAHPDRAKRIKHANSNVNSYKSAGHSKHKAREGTMNWVKKRARTIERTFQRDRDAMPAGKVEDLKRELDTHRRAIHDSKSRKHRQKMIKKYHMIRFFERKKADRLQKQLRKRLAQATDDDEIATINADIHIAEIDKLYAIYFPYLERYISLYPVAKKGEDEKGEDAPDDKSAAELALHSQRPPLWTAIEEAAAKGEGFLEMIRDRQKGEPAGSSRTTRVDKRKAQESSVGAKAKPPVPVRAAETQKAPRGGDAMGSSGNRRERRSKLRQEPSKDDWKKSEDEQSGDDEDGGGFFDFGPPIAS